MYQYWSKVTSSNDSEGRRDRTSRFELNLGLDGNVVREAWIDDWRHHENTEIDDEWRRQDTEDVSRRQQQVSKGMAEQAGRSAQNNDLFMEDEGIGNVELRKVRRQKYPC